MNEAAQQAATDERAHLMQLLVPNESSIATLGLCDEEMASLLQSQCAHMSACAVASATPQQLVGALGLCGATDVCLASVVSRIKGLGDRMPPFASKLQVRLLKNQLMTLRVVTYQCI